MLFYREAELLLSDPEKHDAVWIVSDDERFVSETLDRLRRERHYAVVPLFTMYETEGEYALLSDGKAATQRELAHKSEPMLLRLGHLDREAMVSSASIALLAYLYLRPDEGLKSYRSWHNPYIELYPIVARLNDSGMDDFQWLTMIYRRGLLEKKELLNRIRLCPKCSMPHHNFIDVCPVDQIIEIEKVDFVHCFTCGYVGPEREFLADGTLVCPNCKTGLRHIGVDYDRPMESYICADGHKFVEPDALAECLECGTISRPDELVPREIYAYGLTPEGILAAKMGTISDIYAILEQENFVTPDYFESLLDWMVKMYRRDAEAYFSILVIRLLNIPELVESLGRGKVVEFMDEFAMRLREILRSTDITTRTNETDLWILLPKTPEEGCEIVKSRIERLKSLLVHETKSIDFDTVCHTIGKELPKSAEAKDIMLSMSARLKSAGVKK